MVASKLLNIANKLPVNTEKYSRRLQSAVSALLWKEEMVPKMLIVRICPNLERLCAVYFVTSWYYMDNTGPTYFQDMGFDADINN